MATKITIAITAPTTAPANEHPQRRVIAPGYASPAHGDRDRCQHEARGRLSDMDVCDRTQRPLVLGLSLASLVVGVALLLFLDAPRTLLTVIAGLAAGGVVSAVVSRVWKASIHVDATAASSSFSEVW